MTDEERLLQTVVATAAYYRFELCEFDFAIWVEDLGDYPIEAVSAAFVRHRRDPQRGQFMPRTADILRQLQGDRAEAALIAWAKVIAEVQRCGTYTRAQLDAPTWAALESLGGFGAVCRADERELTWLQRRFCEAFGVHQARAERGAAALPAGDLSQALRLQ